MHKEKEVSKSSQFNSSQNSSQKQNTSFKKSFVTSTEENTSKNYTCYYCKQNHSIFYCADFLALSAKERREKTIQLKLCTNCFSRSSHQLDECPRGGCKFCGQKHNSILHQGKIQNTALPAVNTQGQTQDDTGGSTEIPPQNSQLFSGSSSLNGSSQVLLATAQVAVFDKNGQKHICKALLDNGSMSNFISKDLVDKLCLPQQSTNLTVVGIGHNSSELSKSCDVKIKSLHSNFQVNLHCLVIPQITDRLPSFNFNPEILEIPSYITLSDPTFFKTSKIDLLIGADTYWSLILSGNIKLGINKPILQESKLGWIVTGPLSCPRDVVTSCNFSKTIDIQSQLQKFWELEELPGKCILSSEEQLAEEHFCDTYKRTPQGKFVVSIPLKEHISKLGNSQERAKNQFLYLERKLSKNHTLRKMYCDFMNEYKALSHMSYFNPLSQEQITYFSPHHGVLREDSVTTKLRVVFNCSAESSSGYSYNSIQMVGPTVQEDLYSILVRFRQYTFVVSADVSKMYRQIEIADEFKPLQLIYWRENPQDELRIFSLNTVTYGTASAPFLATRCLFQLAIDHEKSHPEASEIIKKNMYVDDLLCGADSVDKLTLLCQQVSSILQSGSFELRKWKSNSPQVLENLKSENTSDSYFFAPSESGKTLGLLWSCKEDVFLFQISQLPQIKRVTKRIILSDTAKIFDPLGLISPIIILAKIILQNLWKLSLAWDQEVPQELSDEWIRFRSEILCLNQLKIPRPLSCSSPLDIQIHGFADSSQKAYGAAVYLRVQTTCDVIVNLISSKTKVAPIQTVTIPRLELCACLLLAKLFEKVTSCLTINIDSYNLWSDSTVALAWIRTSPHLLQTFVGNRVSQIQKLTDVDRWRYVPTNSNPADLLSRGMTPKALLTSNLWFNGPLWLKTQSDDWPEDISKTTSLNDLPETKNETKTFTQIDNQLFPFKNYSSLSHLVRVFAYVLRFVYSFKKFKEKQLKLTGHLTVEELRVSLKKLCQLAQQESFPQDYLDLSNTKPISNRSKLLSLNPYFKDGLIRVGGRLRNSPYQFDKKHPIILSPKHDLTVLIFRETHLCQLHCGPQMLLASVREKYWPVSGKNLAKRIVRECVTCFKFKPLSQTPLMGHLPESRVSPRLPFSDTGVDYAGPFFYKDRKGRGCKTHKCYLALFVCMTTKCLHLELVTELSTFAFLETFQRFIARRGKPHCVYSDNGGNFVGANNKLNELGTFLRNNQDEIEEKVATNHDIKWAFIPAYSPHQGGIWEAGVKSSKHHLLKVIANTMLTYESLSTVITQIEGILNSRPLTPLSTDPNDLEVLTPAHFLIGRSLNSLPYPDVQNIPINRLNHYEQLELLKQQFWSRWSKEYISQLQERTKWKINKSDIAVGSMVLVRDDNLPPYKWRLGRVVVLHPGADKIVRVVTVKTTSGLIKRAVTKLCPLPLPSSLEDAKA